MGAESRMIRVMSYAAISLLLTGAVGIAEEPVQQTTHDGAAVVCDACSARKKGLLKLKEAREAKEASGAETASLSAEDEPSEE